MSWHEVWHVLVLASTLVGAAGAAILLLAPVVFETYPASLRRARPLVVGLIVLGVALLLVEWLVVHG
jgi:hypothetical protein